MFIFNLVAWKHGYKYYDVSIQKLIILMSYLHAYKVLSTCSVKFSFIKGVSTVISRCLYMKEVLVSFASDGTF